VGALVQYPHNCYLFPWERKLLLSLPLLSSLPLAVVRLSGRFLCYLCHSFFWVTFLLVSQPCLLNAFHTALSLTICKVLLPFMLLSLLLSFGQSGSSSIRVEMVLSSLVHKIHSQRNAEKTPSRLPCPGRLVEELEALVQLSLRKVA